NAARDQSAPALAKQHTEELQKKLGTKAELLLNTGEADANKKTLVDRLSDATTAHVTSLGDAGGQNDTQKSDIKATAKQITAKSNAVKTAVHAKAEELAKDIAGDQGVQYQQFLATARKAFDDTTVGTTVISKALIIKEAQTRAWSRLRDDDTALYNLAKLSLDNKLLHEKADIETSLTDASKANVEDRAGKAIDKRKAVTGPLSTIVTNARKPLHDKLYTETEEYIASGLGADGAKWWRSQEVRDFRAEQKNIARAQAKSDIDTEMQSTTSSHGPATKRFAHHQARQEAHQDVKGSIATKLHELAAEGANAVILDQKADDVIDQAAREAAFAIYEDGGKDDAAKKAAEKAAAAALKTISPKVHGAATKWKNTIVQKGNDHNDVAKQPQTHDTALEGVREQVETDEVGKKSVEKAIKATDPNDGMSKFGSFLDMLVPERGDAVKFKVGMEIPTGYGSVILELEGSAERGTRDRLIRHAQNGTKTVERDTTSLKIGTELRIGYAGSFPGVKLQGTLGFFMRADAESTPLAMKALSYGIYRFLTTACAPLANLWGGSAKKAQDMADADDPTVQKGQGVTPPNDENDLKSGTYRSELWAAMVEEQVFKKDKEARVDLGMSGNFGAELNGGIAKGKLGLRGEMMRTYDHEGLKKSVDTHNTSNQGGHQHSLGDSTFNKDQAEERRRAIHGRTTGAFSFESEVEVKIAGQ
ncbi:MAG TPA: hypothetical protein VLB44_13035, partial [Kofleriaceae bacterium]|nr:hypothetical protein [Kofleriaceae bacterium]